MDHDQPHSNNNDEAQNHMDSIPTLARAHWEQSQESRVALKKIAEITTEKWAKQEFVECEWDYVEAAYKAKKLKEHAMICCFTDHAPLLQDFKDWIKYEMEARQGWPIKQIKFLDKNFLMEAKNKDEEEEDQIGIGSHDVEIHDMDLAENGAGGDEEHPLHAPEDEYIENIVEDLMTTPINVATQTPTRMNMRMEDTLMILDSDGDKSDYEAHFPRETKPANKPTEHWRRKANLQTKWARSRENNSSSALRDFNMIEYAEDSLGGPNLLKGWELEAWTRLKVKHDLKDSLKELGAVSGSHFTWRQKRGNKLEQSQIDHIYLEDKGWWLGKIQELIHDGGQALSDHNPVILKATLHNAIGLATIPCFYTYFKANVEILKKEDTIS
ncbi:unnamed protein product [Calypogeia fissa]